MKKQDSDSKHQEVKKYLKGGGTLTGLQAMKYFLVYRLAPIIHRLKHDEGMKIVNIGNPGSFAKYKLVKK